VQRRVSKDNLRRPFFETAERPPQESRTPNAVVQTRLGEVRVGNRIRYVEETT